MTSTATWGGNSAQAKIVLPRYLNMGDTKGDHIFDLIRHICFKKEGGGVRSQYLQSERIFVQQRMLQHKVVSRGCTNARLNQTILSNTGAAVKDRFN